jgi:hypothetical protein
VTTAEPGDHIADRQYVSLEETVHAAFRDMTLRRQHTASQLCLCWFERAVIDAALGRRLPPAIPEPKVRGRSRKWVKVPWKQSDDEYNEWCSALEKAGSSPTAVLRARVNLYLQLNGDRVAATRAALMPAEAS